MSEKIEMKSQDAAKALTDFVNGSHSKKQFAEALMHEHRYLQREVFDLFIVCMEEWKNCISKGQFDDRNKYVCVMSERIVNEIL